jgi:hypothetical protein
MQAQSISTNVQVSRIMSFYNRQRVDMSPPEHHRLTKSYCSADFVESRSGVYNLSEVGRIFRAHGHRNWNPVLSPEIYSQ